MKYRCSNTKLIVPSQIAEWEKERTSGRQVSDFPQHKGKNITRLALLMEDHALSYSSLIELE
jgi:hypothetical protein